MKNLMGRALILGLVLLGIAAGACAAEAPNGWVQAETEHFLFVFEPRDRAAADELIAICEEVYENVTGTLGSRPPRVPCILRGRLDVASGVTMSLPQRIDLYLTAPQDQFIGARTESWLKLLLTHELTHFVHQSMDRGFFHALSLVFGSDLSSSSLAYLPGWLIEGPAVYEETALTLGGRGRNPFFEMLVRAPAIEGSLFNLEQAAYLSAFPPSGRIYVAGYALVSWLQQSYGSDTLARILEAYLDFPFLGPWAAVAKGTGKSAAAVFADWKASASAVSAASSRVQAGAPASPARVGDWTRPLLTARGLYAYRRTPSDFPAIVSLDPSTGAERVIRRVLLSDRSSFCATGDGRTIWLSSRRWDESRPAEERTSADLFMLDVDSGRLRRLTRDAHLWQPATSSDGSRLVAVQGMGSFSRLVSVDPGTGATRVLYARAGTNVFNPALSPDGATVAFVVNERGMQDIYVADLAALIAGAADAGGDGTAGPSVNTGLARPLMGPDAAGEYFPSFTPDGSVLFCSDRSGSLALYAASLASGTVTLVQQDPVAAFAATIDGESLVYASYAATGYCLKRIPLSALERVPVGAADQPTVSIGTGLAEAELARVLPAGAPPTKPYIDWPVPLLWLPNIVLSKIGPAGLDLAVGAGAVAYGGSLLGGSSWTVDAAWLFGADQPVAGLSLAMNLGAFTIDAASRLEYRYVAAWKQQATSSMVVTWHALDETVIDQSISFALSAGIEHGAALTAAAPFSFGKAPDPAASPAPSASAWIGLPFGMQLHWAAAGSALDFNPLLAATALVTTSFFPALLSLPAAQAEVNLFTALTVPSFLPHQALKLGIKAAYAIAEPAGGFQDSFALARGFPAARQREASGAALVSLDYLMPVALLDQPLLFGWAVTGIGCSVHAERIVDFALVKPSLDLLPAWYVGGDVTVRIVFNSYSLPVSAGLAAALDPVRAFNPAKDLGVYFFIGFDSLAPSAAPSAAQRPRP